MRVKRKNGLTDRQERFCQLRAEGKGQREAYDLAGYSTRQKETARANNANQLEALDYIKARIEELNRLSEAGAVLDLQQIAADLGKIAADENKPDGVRLKAYDQLTRIKGGYTDTTQVALSGSLSLDDKRALFEQMMQE